MHWSYPSWVTFIERHHRRIVLGSVLLAVLCAWSLTRLRLDIDVLTMLPHGKPAFDDFKEFVADFGQLDELIVLVEGQPLPQLQQFAEELAHRLTAMDSVSVVHARVDVQGMLEGMLGRYLYNYLPESAYAELAQRLTPEAIDAQVAADRAMLSAPFDLSTPQTVIMDPFGLRRLAARALVDSFGRAPPTLSGGYFISTDGRALLLFVRPRASAFDIAFSKRLLQQVRDAEAATRSALAPAANAFRIEHTGSYAYALEDEATLKWDVGRYTILALLAVLAIFYGGYRNLRILPFVTYPLVLTTLVTFALGLILFAQLNAVSISFAAILYGLSIDSAIYFYTRLLEERYRHADLSAAMSAVLAGLGRANVAASTTTAAAFLVIGGSVLGAVSQLGVLTAIGMLLTIAEFFILYPALGFYLPPPVSANFPVAETRRLGRWAHAASHHAGKVTAIATLVALVFLLSARRVGLDVALTHLRPQHSPAARVQDEVAARFGQQAAGGAVLVRRADLNQALADSEKVARELRRYRTDGMLRTVQSLDAVLPSADLQQTRLRLYNQLPRAAALATLREALVRHGFVPDRFDDFFASFAKPRAEQGDIVRRNDPALAPLDFLIDHHLRTHGGEALVATYVEPANGVDFRSIADRLRTDLGSVRFTIASRSLLEDELGSVLRHDLVLFCLLGVAGNIVLLLLTFGSLPVALAILAPVMLVVVGLFAAMALAGIPLDPVNLIATPLIFGIGVDYGVYVVARQRECGQVSDALRSMGRPLVVTSLTTIAGFGFLGFSRYPFLAMMGVLTAGGLAFCVVLSIVLLPALLTLGPTRSQTSAPRG